MCSSVLVRMLINVQCVLYEVFDIEQRNKTLVLIWHWTLALVHWPLFLVEPLGPFPVMEERGEGGGGDSAAGRAGKEKDNPPPEKLAI